MKMKGGCWLEAFRKPVTPHSRRDCDHYIFSEYHAFTLIELLVVIAVIAVLAALLSPALSKTRSKARTIDCLNGMKQWCLACVLYKDDNEGWIPREGYEANGSVVWNTWAEVRAAKDAWYNALAPYMSCQPASAFAYPDLRKDFYSRDSKFHCPSAKFPKNAKDPFNQIPFFSRAMNSQLISPLTITYPRCSIRFDRITKPSQTVLILDNRLEGEEKMDGQEDSFLGQPSAYACRFAARRHMKGGNLGFADGHVYWFPGEKVVETKGPNIGWEILPPNEIRWDTD
jgi:prepilin-type N-terminal cleavage/methylation domain-containing protein/prepilin-type processing-associated H-X9-DG protein